MVRVALDLELNLATVSIEHAQGDSVGLLGQ
jgi:hypothetical protein